jgi:hypothetical protein
VALSAFAGAVGLMTGQLSLGDRLTGRLPFHSPVLGGSALALVVGLPFSALAVSIWRRSDHIDRLAVIAGALLVAWIAVELCFVRSFSLLQPVFAAVGAIFIITGRESLRASRVRHRYHVRSATPTRPGGHSQ